MSVSTDVVMTLARARRGSLDRLEVLAHLDDRIWELVGGGPQGLRRRGDLVSLNPQPLLPVDAGRLLLQAMARARRGGGTTASLA